MSRAEIVPVAPGDANTITDPNTTISNLSTATGSIDGVNVRLEAVDRRILKAPTNGFVNYYQDDSGDHDISTTGDLSMTPRLGQTTYTDVPTYDNSTAPAVLSFDSTDMDFAIIRCSFSVEIEGQPVGGSGSTKKQPIMYTRLTANGFPLTPTERAWQCNNLSNASNASTRHNVRQATHVFHLQSQGNLGTIVYRLQYKLDFDGNIDGFGAGDDYRIRDMNFSAVGYRKS